MKKKGPKPKATWNQVKLEGKILSHDGNTLEGFTGLEVLEGYDSRILAKTKVQRDDLNLRNVDRLPLRKKKPEPPKKKAHAASDSEEDIFAQFGEDDYVPAPKKRPRDTAADDDEQSKKKKTAPGKFVLLNAQDNDDSEEDEFDFDGMEECDSDGTEFSTEEESDGMEEDEPNSDDEEIPSLINVKSWQEIGVPEEVLKAIIDKGFSSPTEIQTLTIPPAVFGRRDILGAAETGSGKTLAFGIPIIDGILKHKKTTPESKELYAVILTPTRELASQIHDHLKDIAKYTGIKVASIFGGLAAIKQRRVLKQCPEIIIATPGRLWELIEDGEEHLQRISELRYFVVDETDRMVEKGHFDELQKILKVLNEEEENAKNRQNFIFSATLTMVHDLPDYVLKKSRGGDKPLKQTPGQKLQLLIEAFGVKNPKIVDVTSNTGMAKNLTESRILCQQDQKDVYLYYFLQKHPGRTIVFCNSIECVKRLVSLFRYLNCSPYGLHGNMIQRQRLKNIERFKEDPKGLLIATDVAARGLDIPLVQHVIHYQTPTTTENYVHRSGRTARANNEGIAVLVMDPSEVRFYTKLCSEIGRTEDLPIFPTLDKPLKIARERVNLARTVEAFDLRLRRESAEDNWSQKIAKEAELDSDHSMVDSDDEMIKKNHRGKVKKEFHEKSLQLAKLLSLPMFDANISKYPTSVVQGKNAANNASAIDSVKQVVAEHKEWKKNRNKKSKK